MSGTISVCICTYRREAQLRALLLDLAAQSLLPIEVVVVDNDAQSSAKAVIAALVAIAPFPLRYAVEPEKNISHARNRTLALARGDWLAFLDDDERVGADWLRQLWQVAIETGADGVLAPVVGTLPASTPAWIRRGRQHAMPLRRKSGEMVPSNSLCIGNTLLRASSVHALPQLFDPRFGLTGGEDIDFLTRLVASGAVLRWCDEAVATEPVAPERLRVSWQLLRALRGGQDFAHFSRLGRFGPPQSALHIVFLAVGKMLLAFALAGLNLPLGRHRALAWLIRCSANVGKISAVFGYRYQEYRLPKKKL